VGHPFPGDVRLDPAVINIRREVGIVVIDFLRAILPLDNQPDNILLHNNFLLKPEIYNNPAQKGKIVIKTSNLGGRKPPSRIIYL
jgi:hypothetical protein